jgi:hypothetical protein
MNSNILVVEDLKENNKNNPNDFSFFNQMFDQYFNHPNSVLMNEKVELEDPIIKEYSSKENKIYKWTKKDWSNNWNDIIAIPFILNKEDNLVKYFFIKRNRTTGYINFFIEANKNKFKCQTKNELVNIFALSGTLKNPSRLNPDPLVLGLSNSPSDCLLILNKDKKLCNAGVLIKNMLKIVKYFGIYQILLGDSAGIQCRMDPGSGKSDCGITYHKKNIPLSLQRRLNNKKGFYEEIGFVPKIQHNYDSFFEAIAVQPILSVIPNSMESKYIQLFEGLEPNNTIRDFIQIYSNMTPKNDNKDVERCEWVENFLNEIYTGKNEFLINLFSQININYPEIIKNYSKQVYVY